MEPTLIFLSEYAQLLALELIARGMEIRKVTIDDLSARVDLNVKDLLSGDVEITIKDFFICMYHLDYFIDLTGKDGCNLVDMILSKYDVATKD